MMHPAMLKTMLIPTNYYYYYETLITSEAKRRKLLDLVSHINHCLRLLSYLMHTTYGKLFNISWGLLLK